MIWTQSVAREVNRLRRSLCYCSGLTLYLHRNFEILVRPLFRISPSRFLGLLGGFPSLNLASDQDAPESILQQITLWLEKT